MRCWMPTARAVSLLGAGPRDVSAVYTAMHGVGGEVFMRAVEKAGFGTLTAVAAQFAPDGRFPTVSFRTPKSPAPWTFRWPMPGPTGRR